VLGALEPEWEARFGARSYGFRPGRGCHDAIVAIHTTAKGKNAKRLWVIDADLKAAFDRIDHAGLLASLGTFPGKGMIAGWLKAGVIEKGWFTPTVEGTPQGGVLSPLMANVVLHRLDREWQQRYQRLGVIVRYADDLCICCPTEQRAQAALVVLRELLGGLGLALSGPKTQIVSVASGENGFDFLGFHHRMVASRRHPSHRYPACWPSAKAMDRARSRIRDSTRRSRRHIPTHLLVSELNQFLRGWRQYFRYGNSTRCFAKLDRYVDERMALLLSKRHGRRGRGHGLKLIIGSGNRLGLERLAGTVVFKRTVHATQ